LGQGRENVKKLLMENTELAAELDTEIRKKFGLVENEKKQANEKEDSKEKGKS
jgi:hypothetical protein